MQFLRDDYVLSNWYERLKKKGVGGGKGSLKNQFYYYTQYIYFFVGKNDSNHIYICPYFPKLYQKGQ